MIDKSDPDWWKGKCLGRIGYFPSKYCAKLAGGEKPLQVTHNLQVSDGERGEMTLLRDQIVIQVKLDLGSVSSLNFLIFIPTINVNAILDMRKNKKKNIKRYSFVS